MSTRKAFSTVAQQAATPRFQSALRKLSRHGVDALKPALVAAENPMKDDRWRPPAISNRVAKVLRKQAIRDGTYGSFQEAVGGWDPAWDVELARVKPAGQGRLPQNRVPKKPKYQRTREARALKIESKMEGMDERMDAYHVDKHGAKPARTFENLHKSLMRVKK
jgi:hypothetical protein